MTSKVLSVLLSAVLMLTSGVNACDKYDVPAGSNQDPAPQGGGGGGGGESCAIDQMDISLVSQLEYAGLLYDLAAYVLNAGCDPVKVDDDILRITVVVKDAQGRRLPPSLDNVTKDSPWKYVAQIPLYPGRFSIHLVVAAHMTAAQVADADVEFVGCIISPRSDKAPMALDLGDLQSGRGLAECYVQQ